MAKNAEPLTEITNKSGHVQPNSSTSLRNRFKAPREQFEFVNERIFAQNTAFTVRGDARQVAKLTV
jgi:hypothetical protein